MHGLCELGPEVIKALVLPKIKLISERIESGIEGPNATAISKDAAGHMKTHIIVSCHRS